MAKQLVHESLTALIMVVVIARQTMIDDVNVTADAVP